LIHILFDEEQAVGYIRIMNSETSILDQLLEPLSRCFTPDVARRVTELRAPASVQLRLDELADKCNEGQLSEEERDEYRLYITASNLIAILMAKSRRLLAEVTTSGRPG
jgi:hypothetical protein